ncbi:MAG: SatD family protein [Gemmatimonadaceae bacterium]
MAQNPPVIAVIGDVVQSRAIPARQRARVQAALEGMMAHVNKRYSKAVRSNFLLTLGDEFQGLLADPGAVPDIVQDVREKLPELRLRMAVSRGVLTTPVKKTALGMDGPAWHAARDVLEKSRSRRDTAGVGVWFTGFRDDDVVLDALAGLLGHHWDRLQTTQREVVIALRHHEGLKRDAAKDLGISQQSLSNRAQSAGAREYAAGMDALRAVLRRHAPKASV